MKLLVNCLLAGLIGIASAAHGSGHRSTGEMAPPTWLVLYSPGPSWIDGKPVSEQGLADHFHWLLDLYSRGTMRMAGPFIDDSGGMVVMEGADTASVHALLAGDPAIARGIMRYEVRPLRLHPWERFLQERNERMRDQSDDADGA